MQTAPSTLPNKTYHRVLSQIGVERDDLFLLDAVGACGNRRTEVLTGVQDVLLEHVLVHGLQNYWSRV